jgi:hypothetical protein
MGAWIREMSGRVSVKKLSETGGREMENEERGIFIWNSSFCMKVKDESGKNGERAEMRVHAACVQ